MFENLNFLAGIRADLKTHGPDGGHGPVAVGRYTEAQYPSPSSLPLVVSLYEID